jgi:hypothetical protein
MSEEERSSKTLEQSVVVDALAGLNNLENSASSEERDGSLDGKTGNPIAYFRGCICLNLVTRIDGTPGSWMQGLTQLKLPNSNLPSFKHRLNP